MVSDADREIPILGSTDTAEILVNLVSLIVRLPSVEISLTALESDISLFIQSDACAKRAESSGKNLVRWLFGVKRPFETVYQYILGRLRERELKKRAQAFEIRCYRSLLYIS